MSDPGDRFARTARDVADAERVRAGDVVDVYRGRLVDGDGPVRILAVSSAVDDDRVTEAFDRAADDWADAHTHSGVVPVDARGDSPRPWIAVADDPGETLAAVQPRLSPDERRAVITDVTEALRIARLYNAAHFALAPDDVRVVVRDGDVRALVDGWGLERACRVAAGEAPSSPYTAPELIDDPAGGDERTVVYGLGAVAYYALTGRSPVADPAMAGDIRPASERSPAVPSAVDDVLSTALSRDPAERYDSASAFGTAIERAFPAASAGDGASAEGYAATRATTEAASGSETTAAPDPVDGPVPDEVRALLTDAGYGVVGVVALLVGYAILTSLLFSPLGVAALPGVAEVPWTHDVTVDVSDTSQPRVTAIGVTPADEIHVRFVDEGTVVGTEAVAVAGNEFRYSTYAPWPATRVVVVYPGLHTARLASAPISYEPSESGNITDNTTATPFGATRTPSGNTTATSFGATRTPSGNTTIPVNSTGAGSAAATNRSSAERVRPPVR
jgi:hypothetical protein